MVRMVRNEKETSDWFLGGPNFAIWSAKMKCSGIYYGTNSNLLLSRNLFTIMFGGHFS